MARHSDAHGDSNACISSSTCAGIVASLSVSRITPAVAASNAGNSSLSQRHEQVPDSLLVAQTPATRRSTMRDATVDWCRLSLSDWEGATNCSRIPARLGNGDGVLAQAHYSADEAMHFAKKTSRIRHFDTGNNFREIPSTTVII